MHAPAETIFDCRFCTTDPNLLATASFDSSVRVSTLPLLHMPLDRAGASSRSPRRMRLPACRAALPNTPPHNTHTGHTHAHTQGTNSPTVTYTHMPPAFALRPPPSYLVPPPHAPRAQVWDVRTARCIKLLGGAEGILYSVSWSADGKLLAASNDSGMIYIYDYARGMLIKGLRQHTKQSLK